MFLKAHGVTVSFGKDARNLMPFKRKRQKRIHFNFPHDGSSYSNRTLPKLLQDFFNEASKYQQEGDRINMALANPPGKEEFYQGYYYDIFDASARSGYVLILKREFNSDRYPGYSHTKTIDSKSATVSESASEFIFEKTPMSYEEILRSSEYGPGGERYIYNTRTRHLRSLPIDEGSSDGFASSLSDMDIDDSTEISGPNPPKSNAAPRIKS